MGSDQLTVTQTSEQQQQTINRRRCFYSQGWGEEIIWWFSFFFYCVGRPISFVCLFVCLFSGQQAARIDEVAGAALELVRRPALDEQPALLVEDGGQLASQRGAHQPLRGHQILSTEKQRKQTKNRTVQENTSSFERKKGTRNEKRPSVGQRRERKGQ